MKMKNGLEIKAKIRNEQKNIKDYLWINYNLRKKNALNAFCLSKQLLNQHE